VLKQSHCLATASRAVLCASIPLLIGAQAADGQSQALRPGPAAIAAVRQAIFEAEDRRAPTDADLAILRNGLRHPGEAVQRMAVRAIGRLERPELIAEIEPMLSSPSAPVREPALDAAR